LKLIVNELRRVKKDLIPAKELQRAKDFIRGSTLLSMEHSESQSEYYANEVLFREKVKTTDQRLKDLEKVKSNDIKKLAQELFRTEKLNLAIVSPMKKSREAEFKRLLKV
jgi:predicted Zn-dependent peptidase